MGDVFEDSGLLNEKTIEESGPTYRQPLRTNVNKSYRGRVDFSGKTLAQGQIVYSDRGPVYVHHLLATGGFADVYTGQDDDGRMVVIKALADSMAENPENEDNFLREIFLMGNHPHWYIAPILGMHEEGKRPMFYVMPRFDFTLDNAGLSDRIIRNFLEQQSDVLVHLADNHLIHGDFKPRNIMVDGLKNTFLTDFGGATYRHETDDGRKLVFTRGFAPPEFSLEGIRNEKHDVFSFGMTLARLISRRRLSYGEMQLAVVGDEFSFVPTPLVHIILESTKYDASIRPDAYDLKEMVSRYLMDYRDVRVFDDRQRISEEDAAMGAHESWYHTEVVFRQKLDLEGIAQEVVLEMDAMTAQICQDRQEYLVGLAPAKSAACSTVYDLDKRLADPTPLPCSEKTRDDRPVALKESYSDMTVDLIPGDD